MEINACPICGSKNIRIGTLGDGIISGLSSWNEVCRNCGYQGASLVFDSESAYTKFLEALSNQKKQTQEELEDVKENNIRQEVQEKKNYLFEFIVSVIFTIIFFIFLSLSRYIGIYIDIFSYNYFDNIIIYILGSFIGVFLFFFLLIVLGETLYRSIFLRQK